MLSLSTVTPPTYPPVWRVVVSVLYFGGLATVVGTALVVLVVLGPVVARGTAPGRGLLLLRRASAWSGGVLLVTAFLQLVGRVARSGPGASFGASFSPDRIAAYLTAPAAPGAWIATGTLITIQNACYLLAGLVLIGLLRHDRLHPAAATALALTVLGSLAASIPTKAADLADFGIVTRVLTQIHILGGISWLGGLGVLAVLARRSPFGADPDAVGAWTRVWQRFSSVALVSVGAVVASGSWLTWREVGTVGQLVGTVFGRFLLLKLVLVAIMMAAGAWNQLVLTPRIARARAAGDLAVGFALTVRHFPAVVAGEAVLGLLVLAVVPFLSGSARSQAGEAGEPVLDGGAVALAVLVAALLVASLYTSHRVATTRTPTVLADHP